MADWIGYGITLTIILVTINAFLMVGGGMVNITTSASSQSYFSFLPDSMKNQLKNNEIQHFDINLANDKNFQTINSAPTGQNIATILFDYAKSVFGGIASLPSLFTGIANIVNNLLFGFFYFMADIGVPSSIQFVIGVPLVVIELMTLLFLIMQLLFSVGGFFGK
jgi:hypothetical protein